MWLKLSDDFDDDCQDLSDAAFRLHVQGLLFVMRRERHPVLSERDVRKFSDVDNTEAAVKELLDYGFWAREPDGRLRVRHQMDHQIEPEVIKARKAANAERQKKHRLKKAGVLPPDKPQGEEGVTRYATRDVTAESTRDPGLVGAGLGGPGRSQQGRQEVWPETARPGGWPGGSVGEAVNQR